MKDYLNRLKNEIKRVDHLFFVSLKYTRTVDVLRNVVERMISAFDEGIDALLENAVRKKKIKQSDIQHAPRMKLKMVKELYSADDRILEFMDFYLNLRKISQARYTKHREHRRHVTMTAEIEPQEFLEVNIDLLGEYHKTTKEFFEYLEGILL